MDKTYEELEKDLKKMSAYMDSKEFKNSPMKQYDTFKRFVEIAEAMGKIKKWDAIHKLKLNTIKGVVKTYEGLSRATKKR
jgi:hypothetical protein